MRGWSEKMVEERERGRGKSGKWRNERFCVGCCEQEVTGLV